MCVFFCVMYEDFSVKYGICRGVGSGREWRRREGIRMDDGLVGV